MELGAKFRASDIRVFGSVARGEAGPKSDVDLLVKFDVPQGLLARIEFKERVEALLSRRVDLATAGNLHWLIRPAVIEEAVEL